MSFTIPFPHNGLVSFHYSKTQDLSMYGGFRLIGDSGAFSAHTQGASINVDELTDWGLRWTQSGQLCWAAALDVIRDPVGTRANWLRAKNRGLNAVPSVHFPAPPQTLDDYAKDGVRFLGLGGQVGGNQESLLRWVVSMMRYARDRYPDMRFHGWGATGKMSLILPYYSVDSTSWYEGVLWGSSTLQDPSDPTKTWRLNHDGHDAYRPDLANLLSTYYATDPASVANSRGSNFAAISMMARSASMREIQMRQRIGKITPPPELAGQEDGPRLHLVMPGDGPLIKKMAAALAAETESDRDTLTPS